MIRPWCGLAVAVFSAVGCLGLVLAPTVEATEKTAEKPEIYVPTGHIGEVTSVAFSKDGRLMVSGSVDHTLILWDVSTGREIRAFAGHGDEVDSVAISPDGKSLLSGSHDHTLKLWDPYTGRELRTFSGHSDRVTTVAFSPNGKTVLSGSFDSTLKLWDVNTGRVLRNFSGHRDRVTSVAFSPDGKTVASGSFDTTIRLWDANTGKKLRTLSGHACEVNSVAFSSNGKQLISGSGIGQPYKTRSTLKLWNVVTGKERIAFSDYQGSVRSVSFSPDGKTIVSGGDKIISSHGATIDDKPIKVWDVATGSLLSSMEGNGHGQTVTSLTFSPDGRTIMSTETWTGAIIPWDVATGKKMRIFVGTGSGMDRSVAFSPDGKTLITGSVDNTIKVWDMVSGRGVRTMKGHDGVVESIAFSSDGKTFLSGSWDKTVKLWDSSAGVELRTFSGMDGIVYRLAYSPDGRTSAVVSGSYNITLKLLDLNTGNVLHTLIGAKTQCHNWNMPVVFSPDGNTLVTGDKSNNIKLWDVAAGLEFRTLVGHQNEVSAAAFSPNGKILASGSLDKTVKLWDAATGKELYTLVGHGGSVKSVVFSPDGKAVVSGGSDNVLKLWDVATGKEIRTFAGLIPFFRNVAFSIDGKTVASAGGDFLNLWKVADGTKLATYTNFVDGEWIVITPEGYYHSSLHGHDHLNIRIGLKIYGIGQFYDLFYRPDIMEAKLKGQDISGLITLTIDDALKSPPPTVTFTSKFVETGEPKVKVCYEVKSEGGGIGEVRLFHNDKLIQSDGFFREAVKLSAAPVKLASLNGEEIYRRTRSAIASGNNEAFAAAVRGKSKGNIYKDCREVDATPGENEVSVAAFNSANTIQSVMETANFNSTVKPEEPHLYLLAVGLNKYKDSENNLQYAAKDATDISERLARQFGTIYKPENIHTELLLDEGAGKAQIIDKISEIAKMTKANDTFVLFVAGHGVLLQNQYYLLTHDFDGDLEEKVLISSNEVVEMSKNIKSLSQLFIFDTCHAGGVDSIISGLYDARMSVMAKKMGLHIFASANSTQEAIDGYKGNGLFTHTLLEALDNNKKADMNDDDKVSIKELGEYTEGLVSGISKGLGHAQTPLIIDFGRDNAAYLISRP